MAKLDIRDAYRVILIHPDDCPFLGAQWRDGIYKDYQLPIGLASAPAIFSAFADALEWIIHQPGYFACVEGFSPSALPITMKM